MQMSMKKIEIESNSSYVPLSILAYKILFQFNNKGKRVKNKRVILSKKNYLFMIGQKLVLSSPSNNIIDVLSFKLELVQSYQ